MRPRKFPLPRARMQNGTSSKGSEVESCYPQPNSTASCELQGWAYLFWAFVCHRKKAASAEKRWSNKNRGCQGAQMIRESKQAVPARIFTHDVNTKEAQPKACNFQIVMHLKALVFSIARPTSKLRDLSIATSCQHKHEKVSYPSFFPGSILHFPHETLSASGVFVGCDNSKALITGSSGKMATKK